MTYRNHWAVALIVLIALNLSWEHQTLLIPMVYATDYYHLAAREPFIYRALPALVYHAIMGRRADLLTGLNAPFDSSSDIFQLAVDTVSVTITLIFMNKIVRVLNPEVRPAIIFLFSAVTALVIVVFGFYMVPNRALFYPYDFPDMCFATIIFYLCVRLQGRAEFLLAPAVFIATLNKETAVFYTGLYVAMRAGQKPNWNRMALVVVACGAAFLAARAVVMQLVGALAPTPPAGQLQYEVHLSYTIEQFRNPLFVFAMLNVCSYLYAGIFLLRRQLDRTDYLILFMVVGWAAIMSVVGIIRELRIFVPASLMMFVIMARHLESIIQACWAPARTKSAWGTARAAHQATAGELRPALERNIRR